MYLCTQIALSAVVVVTGIVIVYVPAFTCSSSLSMRTLTVKEMMTRNPYMAVAGLRHQALISGAAFGKMVYLTSG